MTKKKDKRREILGAIESRYREGGRVTRTRGCRIVANRALNEHPVETLSAKETVRKLRLISFRRGVSLRCARLSLDRNGNTNDKASIEPRLIDDLSFGLAWKDSLGG